MTTGDAADLAEGIDRAIDELLTVRVALTDAPVALPALDGALRRHPEYQVGRQEFAAAIEALLDSPWDGLPQAVADVVGAANLMAGRAVEVAWQLALRVRPGSS